MFVLAEDQAVVQFPYSFDQLRADNPNTSFPIPATTELLESWGVYEVVANKPDYNPETHALTALNPTWDADSEAWVEAWDVVELSDAEKAAIVSAKADYKRFHELLLVSDTYQVIKQQATTTLAVTVACTEFIAAITDAKYGSADKTVFQACLDNIVAATSLSDEHKQAIQRLLNLSYLGSYYTVWEGELPAETSTDDNPAGGN